MTGLRQQQRRMLDDWLPLGGAALGTALAGYCFARGRRRRGGPVRAAVAALGAPPWRNHE
jgi:hypothetical protein